jgi:hypothetical protein
MEEEKNKGEMQPCLNWANAIKNYALNQILGSPKKFQFQWWESNTTGIKGMVTRKRYTWFFFLDIRNRKSF